MLAISLLVAASFTSGTVAGVVLPRTMTESTPEHCYDSHFLDFLRCQHFPPATEWCQWKVPLPQGGPGNPWPECHGDAKCEILDILRVLEQEEEHDFLKAAW